MAVRIDNPGRRISERELKHFEARLGATLPEDYASFLLQFNGGEPTPKWFVIRGSDEGSSVDLFFSLGGSSDVDLEQEIRIYKGETARIPPQTIPVAQDPFGNLILVSLKGSDRGSVYFWDHEEEPDPNEDIVEYENVYLLANSFDEFLGRLKG
jgi:hypothetical protein